MARKTKLKDGKGRIHHSQPRQADHPDGQEQLWDPPEGIPAVLAKREPDGAVTTLRFRTPYGEVLALPVHINDSAQNLGVLGTVWRCDLLPNNIARVQPEIVAEGDWRTKHPVDFTLVEQLPEES